MTDHAELVERLKTAAQIIDEANLPDDIRAAAFQSVVAELRGGQTPQGTPVIDNQPPADAGPGEQVEEATASADDFFSNLTDRSGVPEETLRDAFYVDIGGPHINLRGAQLGDSIKARAMNIIVLIAGAHRLGLGRNVSSSTVRDEAGRFSALDRNFSTHVRDLSQYVSYSGGKKSKVIDLKPAGEAEFARRLGIGGDEG